MTKIDSVKVALGSTVLIMLWFIVHTTLSVSQPIAAINVTVTSSSEKLETLIDKIDKTTKTLSEHSRKLASHDRNFESILRGTFSEEFGYQLEGFIK